MPETAPTNDKMRLDWIKERTEDLKTQFRGRDYMMSGDRMLLKQAYRTKQADMPNIMSAEPRNLHRLALDIMTLRPPRIQVAITDQDAVERDNMNALERFGTALLRLLDRNWRMRGNRRWLRDVVWYDLMGGYAIRPLVRRVGEGRGTKTRFTADVWDPLQTYPEWDADGLCFVVHTYKDSVKAIRERMGYSESFDVSVLSDLKDKDDAEVLDAYWREGDVVFNNVVIDGRQVKKDALEPIKQFGSKIPVIVGPANGDPYREFTIPDHVPWFTGWDTHASLDWTATAWESILATGRQTYLDFDQLLNHSATIVKNHAEGKYLELTADGRPLTTPQQWRRANKITGRRGDSITPIPPPTSPREREALLEYFMGSLQRSGISFLAFGSLGIELSGVTVDSLINATQSVLAPYVESTEYAIAETLMSLVDQFNVGKFPAVELETMKQVESLGERAFVERYDRSMLPKTGVLSVDLPLALPDTLAARLVAARQAVGDNRALVSEQTIHEKLLQDIIPDSHQERKNINEDKVRNSPQADALSFIQGLREVVQDAMARGDREMAMASIVLMQSTMAQFQQIIAGSQERTAGIDAQRNAQAGASITEPSPSVAPPEETGARPDDVDVDRLAGNRAVTSLLARRGNSVNGR